jgi:hypothetical protein
LFVVIDYRGRHRKGVTVKMPIKSVWKSNFCFD